MRKSAWAARTASTTARSNRSAWWTASSRCRNIRTLRGRPSLSRRTAGCEKCAIVCPVDAITMVTKHGFEVKDGRVVSTTPPPPPAPRPVAVAPAAAKPTAPAPPPKPAAPVQEAKPAAPPPTAEAPSPKSPPPKPEPKAEEELEEEPPEEPSEEEETHEGDEA